MNLLCGLVLFGVAAAEPEPSDPILAKVKEIAAQPAPAKPEDLARTLTAGLTSDQEKLAAIQHWVVEALVYDYEGLNRGRAVYDAATCYKQRRGVCQAISGLFVQMARSVSVPVEEVAGEARELIVTANGPKSEWIPHSWVRYKSPDGIKWIDPTFSLPGQIKGLVTPGLGWFLLEPNLMANSHRPTRNRQETEPLVDRKSAELAPEWDWSALTQHRLMPPQWQSDFRLDNKLGFEWPNSEKSEFLAKIQKASDSGVSGRGQTLVLKGQNSTKFYFSPKSAGWHKIQLFVKSKGSSEPYRSLCTIPLQVAEVEAEVSFPELYADYTTMGIEMVSGGESGVLPSGEEITLKYKMAAEGTLVIFPKKEGMLDSEDIKEFSLNSSGVWEWKGKLTSGEWLLGAKLPNSNRIKFLALYRVK